MAAGVKFFQPVGKILGDTAVGINSAFNAVTVQHIHDAPDAGFAAVFAVSEGGIIGFVSALTILRILFKRFKSDEKTDSDLRVVGPFDRCRSHVLSPRASAHQRCYETVRSYC